MVIGQTGVAGVPVMLLVVLVHHLEKGVAQVLPQVTLGIFALENLSNTDHVIPHMLVPLFCH